MKDNTIYNNAENKLYVKTNGDKIVIICSKESQQEQVIKRMTTDNCILDYYEEWDEGENKKWIMTWKVPQEYDKEIQYN